MVAAASGRRNREFHHPGPFPVSQVISALTADQELPPNAKLVLRALLSWADPQTSVLPSSAHKSVPDIATACNLSKSTVIRMLNLLERTGWMRRAIPNRHHETTEYQPTIPGLDSGVSGVSGVSGSGVSASSPCPNQAELVTVVPPSGVLPGSRAVPPSEVRPGTSSRKSSPRGARAAGRAKELTSATDNVSGENARAIVAAYIDSYRAAWGLTPIDPIVKRIGRDAKLLLAKGIEFGTVLDAATELGGTEYANLSTVAHRLVTRRENDPRYHAWQNVRTISPYPVSSSPGTVVRDTGSWDAVGTWGREVAVAPNWDDAGPSNWDVAVRWYAGEDGDDYHNYDGSDVGDDEVREACL